MLDQMIKLCALYENLIKEWAETATSKGTESAPAKQLQNRHHLIQTEITDLAKQAMTALESEGTIGTVAALTYFNSWLILRGGWGAYPNFTKMFGIL